MAGRIAPLRDETTGLVVLERLHDLVARVHHEGAVRRHGLVDRLPGEEQRPETLSGERKRALPRLEPAHVALAQRPATHLRLALEHVDETAVARGQLLLDAAADLEEPHRIVAAVRS